ncbi:MAG: helicase-exonuclease AddAB subunit AddA, partial [Lachnospiraceae bacterium]
MSVNWTTEQQQVIESRNSNLLVSAAAGSGKTAVLVERIIKMVTDPDHPIDIDKLLVMTFTNAAAAEMRERIGAAIEQQLSEHPRDEHLQIQSALVHHAQITTIDSFCLNLIRNHFNRLELDPSFRIGDEGELTLLKADVMAEMLESYYEQGGEAFERFVETYAQGKSDAGIEDYITQVYTFSQSNPYPHLWILECRNELAAASDETGWEDCSWMKFLMKDVKLQMKELQQQLCDVREICAEDEYLCAYEPMLANDTMRVSELLQASDYEELYEKLVQISWDRLAAVRSKEVDSDKKAYVTGCRERVKKAVTKLKELYCFAPPEEMKLDLACTADAADMLLELAEEFSRRYQDKKQDRNVVDFNDLEHEALRVLIEWRDGKQVYTDIADELSEQYEEVLVDEYQDSNLVQETLIHAVSRERFGQPNVFMVGDVKQSIYKFRLARPELFLDKYESYQTYGTSDSHHQKIELHQNFRSRDIVLHGINEVFYRIMTPNLGNIRYTEEVALHPGAHFAETEEMVTVLPELLVVDTGDVGLAAMEEDAADFTAREIEAKLIGAKIREMTDPQQGMLVWDKKLAGSGGYRLAQYRDIVVLLRSTSGWTENFLEVLMNDGIPAYAESRMGYFNTIEVETILSLLAVIDNPMQDIPLAAVLKSPMIGMTDQELAEIVVHYRRSLDKGQDRGLYPSVKLYARTGDDKLTRFLALLEAMRARSKYLPIHELLYQVYERTGYYDYVSAMPAGETRRANLDMLVEKAAAYEQTSYKGLFHFIRYIENLKRYQTDYGEAATVGEEDNTVRIMSIHKSKGLEFPIVILAGMGKKFNKQDVYGKVLIDPELGIATDYVDIEKRLKTSTLKKQALRRKMELDGLGEELRVLYVAMTRAKERLIMTGTDRYLTKTMEKYNQIPLVNGQIPYTILATAGSYLDWVLMSLGSGSSGLTVNQIPVGELVGRELHRKIVNQEQKERFLRLDIAQVYEPQWHEMLAQHLNYQYPFDSDVRLHTKMSVSELKKQGQMTDEEESVKL